MSFFHACTKAFRSSSQFLLFFRNQSALKQLALTGAMWTFGGYAASQMLRLGGNLILTRLLFPEAFGLMAIVQVWMVGLQMFSDIGIVPAIIQSRRGEETEFLNTAWTIQVFRGGALWICSILLAWPVATLYHEPMLTLLLPVVGLNAFINGFNSTKLATVNRNLLFGRLVMIETGSYAFGLLVMILWALQVSTIWALVGGGIVTSLAKMAASHLVLDGPSNKFQFDKKAFHDLRKFGNWIFVSTIITFLSGQGDRLLIGYILDVRFLAFYTLALNMSNLFHDALRSVGGKVLFPVYAQVLRENPQKFYAILRKSRLLQILLSWIISFIFIIFGKQLMALLYDARYVDSGWILQILAIGQLVHVLESSNVGVMMASGKTRTMTVLLAFQSIIQIISLLFGYHFFEQTGMVYGIMFSKMLFYPVNAYIFHKYSLWQPEIDLPFLAIFLIVLLSFLIV